MDCDINGGGVMRKIQLLTDILHDRHSLSEKEYELLIMEHDEEDAAYAASLADAVRRQHYGTDIYVRGLIEVGNICRNDCYYCGIRRSNKKADRYALTNEQILLCAEEGYRLGYRTFVMQGGEGSLPLERILQNVEAIKHHFPDAAVTLSLGEYERDAYQAMFDAGADRYLLRHETADREHYQKLHPDGMSFEHRMRCLQDLKEIGFQTGCGFMVGSPYQTAHHLAKDLKFIEEFSPQMCGIGPFIPHKDTIFRDEPAGSVSLTIYLLSLIRLIKPNILLPATTALGTLDPLGREKGVLAGANVIMPNLPPYEVRPKYELYDHKISTGEESAQSRKNLEKRMEAIGFRVVTARGDYKESH